MSDKPKSPHNAFAIKTLKGIIKRLETDCDVIGYTVDIDQEDATQDSDTVRRYLPSGRYEVKIRYQVRK